MAQSLPKGTENLNLILQEAQRAIRFFGNRKRLRESMAEQFEDYCVGKVGIEECFSRASRLEEEIVHAQNSGLPDLALIAPCERYIEHLTSEGRAPKTWGRYRGELEQVEKFL